MKKYYGNYLGLVVEDFDPEYRNRIKVFVPALSTTLLAKINSKRKDVIIAGVGVNLPDSLDSDAYDELIRILPWAECAAPLFGGGTSSHYNRNSRKSTNKSNPGNDVGIQPDISAAETTGRSELGRNSDAWSGAGLSPRDFLSTLDTATFNKLKFVASIGQRETGFSIKEAYTDANNQLKNNDLVIKEYVRLAKPAGFSNWQKVKKENAKDLPTPLDNNALRSAVSLYGDYGFYQVNLADTKTGNKINTAMNGVGQTLTTALEQTVAIINYIDNVMSKTHHINKRNGLQRFGVSEIIAAGNFSKAGNILNDFWNSLPGGLSYHSHTEAFSQQILQTTLEDYKKGNTLLNRATSTATFSPSDATTWRTADSSKEVVKSLQSAKIAQVNENSYDANATYTTGLPGGMFSTPKINSRVWVFFNDGDLQYPVYFAQHVIVEDWARIKSSDGSGTNQGSSDSANDRKSTSVISQPGSGLIEFITQQSINPDTKEMREQSGVKLSTVGGGMISIMSGGNTEYAVNNKTTTVAGNCFLTVEGHQQTAIKSSSTTVISEDSTTIIGDVSEESIQAAKSIKALLKTGHDIAVESHKEPSSKKSKCPICWGAVTSEKGTLVSKILTRLSTAVLNLFGRDTVASRHVGEVLKIAIAPLKDTTVRKIRNGDCGNPSCVGGLVPEYTANIPQIEQEAADYHESIFDQIIKHEQNLGVGGNQTTVIAKNSVTKVGLITNDLTAHVQVDGAVPINNGVEFVKGEGPIAAGDSVPLFKVLDVPGTSTGVYELFVGSRYNLKVGSRGIHMQTSGNIELDCSHLEFTSNYISLGNNKGITKICGAAVQIEATKSITLGGAPTNVHIKGNAHVTANITAQGSIYADGNIYAKRLVVPCAVQKTDLASAADYTSGLSVFWPMAAATFAKNLASKIPKHYNPVLSGLYPATGAGMSDVLVDWLTKAQLTSFYDNWGAPTGQFFGIGSGTVFTWPHIHLHHNSAHSHSHKGPDGMYVNDQEEVSALASACGGAPTLGGAPIPDKGG